jgi:S1-C subfamily serine protease
MMMVAEVNPGQEVNLDIIRNGKKITRSLELADREKSLTPTERTEPATENREDWLGLQVNTSTRELAAQYQVKFHSGVMVLEVNAGSLAEQAGFLTGDIIVKVNDLEIADSDAYQKAIEPLINRGKAILFLVYRNGEPFFIAVKAE